MMLMNELLLNEIKEKVYQYEKGIKGTVRKTFRDVFDFDKK